MNNKYILFLIFLIANFGALGIGTILMNEGPTSNWYTSLNQAPWTPVGWVFGAAWTTIMLLFSVYMTKLALLFKEKKTFLIQLFLLQWLLNVSWNFVFFNQHLITIGLIVILCLWLLIGYFTFNYIKQLKWATLLIAPYLIWLTIASSLNAYIVLYNS